MKEVFEIFNDLLMKYRQSELALMTEYSLDFDKDSLEIEAEICKIKSDFLRAVKEVME